MRSLIILLALLHGAHAADPIRPDPGFTPGMVAISDTKKICLTKWGKDERHVTLSMKKIVFQEYGIPYSRHAEFEVDHLISRELGGADAVHNLWPQTYSGPWNAHMKDRLENKLHKMVCAGQITLKEAQSQIAHDWIACYKKNFPQ